MTHKYKILNFIERLDEAGDSAYAMILKPTKVKFALISSKSITEAKRNKRFFYGHRTISGLVCLDVKESSFLALEVTIITVTVKFLSSFVAQSLAFNRKFILNGHR